MSTNASTAGLALLGGVPTRAQDLPPSIIFVVLYVILIPLAAWRFSRPSDRCWLLARPAVFVVVRIATFVVRAVQANNRHIKGLSTAQQVLLTSGTIFVLDPLLEFVSYHVTRHASPTSSFWTTGVHRPYSVRLFQIALWVGFALGIYSVTKYWDLDDPGTLHTVISFRNTNAIINLVVAAGSALVVIVCHATERPKLPIGASLLLAIIAALLTAVSALRLYVYYADPAPAVPSGRMKAAFYCLSVAPEWITALLYFAAPIAEMTDLKHARDKLKESEQMRKALLASKRGDVSVTSLAPSEKRASLSQQRVQERV